MTSNKEKSTTKILHNDLYELLVAMNDEQDFLKKQFYLSEIDKTIDAIFAVNKTTSIDEIKCQLNNPTFMEVWERQCKTK